MNNLEIYFELNYKYQLLFCLLLNHYRNYYLHKYKGQILVICTSKRELMKNYDKFYSTIKSLTKNDVGTLKKFLGINDKMLEQLFEYYDDNNISYQKVIKDIKETFKEEKSFYADHLFGNTKRFPKDKNVVFVRFNDFDNVYEKHLIKEIFIPEYFELGNDYANELCRILFRYVREINKVEEVLKSNGNDDTNLLPLNVFMNTNNGMAFMDEISERLEIFGNDEED